MKKYNFVLNSLLVGISVFSSIVSHGTEIGREVSVNHHLQDGEEFTTPLRPLLKHGQTLFEAVWTGQEGGGRPQTKGVGKPLSDPSSPLLFPRNFNRISAPDANSCAGCHNKPFSGGGGDIVANVFVTGQRFDFATFDSNDPVLTGGALDETGVPVTLQTIANSRNTLGMFGSGYIEMLAREMTADLQAIRNSLAPGQSAPLKTKEIIFGSLARNPDGSWDVAAVEGLPSTSLATTGSDNPPNLIIRPFHQAGAVVSIREFTNNAFNHHHGIQSTERFGKNTDPDADGHMNEMSRADVTAVTLLQAQLPAPGRVIPNDPDIEAAVLLGERKFEEIGCAGCHVPKLPLTEKGQVFTEPNPYNPAGNLRTGDAPTFSMNLNDKKLDQPRLHQARDGRTWVPAFTDLKLHDITSGPADPNREPINMHAAAGSPQFFTGNSHFLTRKLWGIANEPPYFHHGQYTTLREAIEAHHGEAEATNQSWHALSDYERGSIIEFLKTLQVLPPGTHWLIVDEKGNAKDVDAHGDLKYTRHNNAD